MATNNMCSRYQDKLQELYEDAFLAAGPKDIQFAGDTDGDIYASDTDGDLAHPLHEVTKGR